MKQTERTTLPLDSLVPSPYNPRRISDDAAKGLQSSIEKFGMVQDIVVNRKNNRVVGGNQRLSILRGMDIEEVPVVLVDLDEDEEKALCVALNNGHIQGEWTPDLKELLDSITDKEILDGLRTDTLVEALTKGKEDEAESTIEEVDMRPPPKMVWALVAVPSEKWSDVSSLLEQVSKTEGVIYDSVIR
jgi:hypothetical protein